jgi:hypothetical protein
MGRHFLTSEAIDLGAKSIVIDHGLPESLGDVAQKR